jgi:hypothetical protein
MVKKKIQTKKLKLPDMAITPVNVSAIKGDIISKKLIGKLYNNNIYPVMLKYNGSRIQVPPKGNALKIDKNKIDEEIPCGIVFIGE